MLFLLFEVYSPTAYSAIINLFSDHFTEDCFDVASIVSIQNESNGTVPTVTVRELENVCL